MPNPIMASMTAGARATRRRIPSRRRAATLFTISFFAKRYASRQGQLEIHAPLTNVLMSDIRSGAWRKMVWSFNIGKVFGTVVRIHVTFLLLLVWIWFMHYRIGGAAAAWEG